MLFFTDLCGVRRWTVSQWTRVQKVCRSSWCPSLAVAMPSCSALGLSRTQAAQRKRPLPHPAGRAQLKYTQTHIYVWMYIAYIYTYIHTYICTLVCLYVCLFLAVSEGPSRDVILHLTTGRIHNKNVSTHLIGSISKGNRLSIPPAIWQTHKFLAFFESSVFSIPFFYC